VNSRERFFAICDHRTPDIPVENIAAMYRAAKDFKPMTNQGVYYEENI